jgi:hypothetical protein
MFILENIIFNETVKFLVETENNDEKIINAIENMMEKSKVLTFSNENSKLGGKITTFSLPAGWTCPYAEKCKMKVSRSGKEREVGEKAEFMCYEAWMEVQYKAKRENNWHNYDLLNEANSAEEKAKLIVDSLKYHFQLNGHSDYVRIHEGGDFYKGAYLQAWIEAAKQMPDVIFYAYTKSLPLVYKMKNVIDTVPNFKLNISAGSSRPELEGIIGYPVASVFNTPEEVLKVDQLVDLDDSIAYDKENKQNFALLVHGMQTFELDTPDITKNRVRNEVFMKYYKFKNKLNNIFGFPVEHEITSEEAKNLAEKINKLLAEKKIKKDNAKDIIFMLNNVIKYNKYNFDKNLINIIPPKFR